MFMPNYCLILFLTLYWFGCLTEGYRAKRDDPPPPPPSLECSIQRVTCDPNSEYRSFNGYCNNLNNPEFGAKYNAYPRKFPNDYDDGIEIMKSLSSDGSPLRGSREISLLALDNITIFDNRYSHLFMIFGQFLSHEVNLSPEIAGSGPGPFCVSCDEPLPCAPIPVPRWDLMFPPDDVPCLRFVRTQNYMKNGIRSQFDAVTSYLDGSNVYGSDIGTANLLRELGTDGGGRMKTQENGLLPMPPMCPPGPFPGACYLAGDVRVNQHIPLVSMHTLWLTIHNMIAGGLAQVQPSWDNDKLFFESRKILGGLLQRIVYTEFLPILLGEKTMKQLDISEPPENSGEYMKNYDDTCDATVLHEFSSAVNRFGHTTVNDLFKVSQDDGDIYWELGSNIGNVAPLQDDPSLVGAFLLGSTSQAMNKRDRFVSDAIRNLLIINDPDMLPPGAPPAVANDLIATNTQRGRDHGVKSYTFVYEELFGVEITNWDDFVSAEVFSQCTIYGFQKVYKSVHDIELYIGVLAEIKETKNKTKNEGILGPVGTAIIGENYKNLKKCDRFFYSIHPEDNPNVAFSKDQLREIRGVKFRDLICQVLDPTDSLPPAVLQLPSFSNQPYSCADAINSFMDFEPWNISESEVGTLSMIEKTFEVCGFADESDEGVTFETPN